MFIIKRGKYLGSYPCLQIWNDWGNIQCYSNYRNYYRSNSAYVGRDLDVEIYTYGFGTLLMECTVLSNVPDMIGRCRWSSYATRFNQIKAGETLLMPMYEALQIYCKLQMTICPISYLEKVFTGPQIQPHCKIY